MNNLYKITPSILTGVGLVVTLYLAFVKRNFSAPKLKLTVGLSKMYVRHKSMWKLQKKNIFFIFNKNKTRNPLVCIPIKITNIGSHPFSDIIVRLTSPVGFDIISSSLKFFEKMSATRPESDSRKKPNYYDYSELGDQIQIIVKIEKLRVGETTAIPLILRAEPHEESSDINSKVHDRFNSSSYKQRYNKLSNFISAMSFYAGVFSSDAKPVELRINVVSLDCVDEIEAKTTIENMIKLSWEGKYPKPGFYWKSPIWFLKPKPYNIRKIIHPEYSELLFSELNIVDYADDDIHSLTAKLYSYNSLECITSLAPWGFFNNSFDIVRLDKPS